MKRIRHEQTGHTDRRGSVDGGAYLLLITILGIGMVCGLATMRDQFVQEFGDLGSALEQVNQSYSITIGTVTSQYTDTVSAMPEVPNPIGFVNSGSSE